MSLICSSSQHFIWQRVSELTSYDKLFFFSVYFIWATLCFKALRALNIAAIRVALDYFSEAQVETPPALWVVEK